MAQVEVDEKRHYGKFDDGDAKNKTLLRRIVERSVNLCPAMDDVNIDNHSRHGMGLKELTIIGGLIIGSGFLGHQLNTPPPTPPTPPAIVVPDQTLKVRIVLVQPDGTLTPIEVGVE